MNVSITIFDIFHVSQRKEFHNVLSKARHIVVLTGAGISAESGVPTFRGSGGYWRKYDATKLATPQAFKSNPSLVWEFYHYRRELCRKVQPNKAHFTIAEIEQALNKEGRKLTVITQNVDNLHRRAGSNKLIELHGNLYKTKCLKCEEVVKNQDSPICPALDGKGAPDAETNILIPESDLPRCKKPNCKGLLRPHIVWFGENLEQEVLDAAENAMDECDACLVVGTSSIVYPAAMFAPALAQKGITVAEFNLESTPATSTFKFHFKGPCSETIPKALDKLIILNKSP